MKSSRGIILPKEKRHRPHGRCGLKFGYQVQNGRKRLSSSSRTVWIEIPVSTIPFRLKSCHRPHGRCGLKLCLIMIYFKFRKSSSSRTVWIEMPHCRFVLINIPSSSSRTVWIEISVSVRLSTRFRSHRPHGRCGLKSDQRLLPGRSRRHRPHGRCGLKYRISFRGAGYRKSSSSRTVWIEIRRHTALPWMASSSSSRTVWI